MKPNEFYDTDAMDFADMILAYVKRDEEVFDEKMRMLAWQTANIINGCSRRKKPVKMTDLYTGLNNENVSNEKQSEKKDVESLRQELRETFGI